MPLSIRRNRHRSTSEQYAQSAHPIAAGASALTDFRRNCGRQLDPPEFQRFIVDAAPATRAAVLFRDSSASRFTTCRFPAMS
jgi:hypothetical protein